MESSIVIMSHLLLNDVHAAAVREQSVLNVSGVQRRGSLIIALHPENHYTGALTHTYAHVCARVCVFNTVWKAASQFQVLCRLTITELISFLKNRV